MQPIPGDPELLHQSSVLIYPFRHQAVDRQRNARLAALEPRWAPWASRFGEHDLATALEATAFFLPYIRGLLYPDILRLEEETPIEDPVRWAQLLRAWSASGVAGYVRDLPAAGVVRLTLRSSLMKFLSEFLVVQESRSPGYSTEIPELPGRFPWIDAVLFPSGLGFLLLNVQVGQEQPRLSALIQLNQVLRQVHPLKHSMQMPVLRLAGDEEMTVRDLMNFLTQGLAEPWHMPEEERSLFPIPAARSGGERPYTESETGRGYGERCYLLSYACVDLAGGKGSELAAGPFASPTDRMVFEYATCIGLGESVSNPMWVPSPEQAARLSNENRLAFWRCWTGMVLKESLVFLATEDLGFTRRSLPRIIEYDYLPLYLFALYQKLQLFTFASDMMHEVALSCGHLRGARALQQRFVAFRSQYWFGEVTRKPQGGDLYRTFQRGLEVQTSYDLVTSSIKDVKDYYESVWTRQVQMLKDTLTYGGPLTMALGAVRMIVGDSPHTWTIGGLVTGGLVLLMLMRMCLRMGWFKGGRIRPGRARRTRSTPRLWQARQQTPSVPA